MAKDSVVRNNVWKWAALALIAFVSYYVCTPVAEKLRFGLDLKGDHAGAGIFLLKLHWYLPFYGKNGLFMIAKTQGIC